MELLKSIRRLFFGYTVESRSSQTIKILGITFEYAKIKLLRKKGLHEVLLLSFWDQPITLRVLLSEELREQIKYFFDNAVDKPEAQLLLPLHHNALNLNSSFGVGLAKEEWIANILK